MIVPTNNPRLRVSRAPVPVSMANGGCLPIVHCECGSVLALDFHDPREPLALHGACIPCGTDYVYGIPETRRDMITTVRRCMAKGRADLAAYHARRCVKFAGLVKRTLRASESLPLSLRNA